MAKLDNGDKRIPEEFDLPSWLNYPRLEEWYAMTKVDSALFNEFGFDKAFLAFKKSLLDKLKH